MEELKVPKERIAILVGKNGETKRKISKLTKTKLKIDSREGDVIIEGEDSIACYNTKKIIKAIGRGFNPDIALTLLDENNMFELIDIQEYCGKSKNGLRRIKARLIGTKGKARKLIENLTDTDICIYGKTVGVIGYQENVLLAKQAIKNLLQGSRHGNVYAFIENQKMSKLRKTL